MQQDLAKTILDHIGDGIISVDDTCRVVFANDAARYIVGVESDNFIGQKIGDVMTLSILDENGVKSVVDPFGVALTTGESKSYQVPMVIDSHKNKLVYIEDTISPIRGSNNEILGAVMVFRDVTEEVRLIELLKTSNERYKILFESIKSSVAVYMSTDGETFDFVDFNTAAEQLEGVSRHAVIGQNVTEVFPGVTNCGLLDALKRVWKTGKSERLPCILYEDNVRKTWRDNYVYRLPTGEVVSIYDDVTAKRERAENFSNSIEQLRDKASMMERLFLNAAIGIVVFDSKSELKTECKILKANQAFCDIVGYSMNGVVGMSILDITHLDDIKISSDAIEQIRSKSPSGGGVSIKKRYIRKDGEIRWASVFLSQVECSDGHIEYFNQVVDITETKRTDDEKTTIALILSELNSSGVKSINSIQNIASTIKNFANLDAIAIRLPEHIDSTNKLVDYPFYYYSGFDNEFIAKEMSLFCVDSHGVVDKFEDGTAQLSCMCGNVIQGRIDKNKPFFTNNGSFWTNSTSDLCSNPTEKCLATQNRNACWRNGYESVAIIPLYSGEVIVGSMLLNAKRRNAFDARMIEYLENTGKTMGVAFSRMQMLKDIEIQRQSLERANSIFSIQYDISKGLASGNGSLDKFLENAGVKLKAKWVSFITVRDKFIGGMWGEKDGSRVDEAETIFGVNAKDIAKIQEWIDKDVPFFGKSSNVPVELQALKRTSGGQCVAIPVCGEPITGVVGAIVVESDDGQQWSKHEVEALSGLATMLCLFAKSEKNTDNLSRKIQETIKTITDAITRITINKQDSTC